MVKEVRDCKSACKTMGYARKQRPPPTGTRVSNEIYHQSDAQQQFKDNGHKSSYKHSIGTGLSVNDRVNNANEIIPLPVPKLSRSAKAKINVDLAHLYELCLAGLQPAYIHKPSYGKTPAYLKERMKELVASEERQRTEEIRSQILCQYVPADERTEVLEVVQSLDRDFSHFTFESSIRQYGLTYFVIYFRLFYSGFET